ncbi:GtrA family protein [Tropicimonas marinistellae]|uniref:GtrA family protein n=1 Tax=Tropicimonas marinistellae TaxID=1739787 RepID=UPI00082B4E81|nr:GtrA family protein [Tropicimonas marinistellae]
MDQILVTGEGQARPHEPAHGGLFGQALRYGLVGIVNTVVSYVIIVSLHLWGGVALVAANVAGYAIGLAISYVGNRSWTFSDASGARSRGHRRGVVAFLVLVAIGFCANLAVTAGLTGWGVNYPLSQLAGFVAYSTIVFLGLRHVVFAPGR